LWQNISITPCDGFEYMMLDAGLSILDLKKWILPYLIQYRASRIEYLALYCSNVNANDIFIFGSGLSCFPQNF